MKFLNKIIRFLFSRVFIVALLILIQAAYLLMMVIEFSQYYAYVQLGLLILSFLAFIKIINDGSEPGYKQAWLIPILLVPLLGGLMYLIFGGQKMGRFVRRRIGVTYDEVQPVIAEGAVDIAHMDKVRISQQARYIHEKAGFPIWQNTEVTYLPIGETMFEKLVEELEKAEHFIFLEYFIIEAGVFWDTILEILKRKVQQGVDVRVMYDDVGCVVTLPYKYDQYLKSLGIRCVAFNSFVPFLSVRMNNRSHRKIAIIDGYTSFTGGINLADEYINKVEKYGHWKDTGVMLKGAATWNFTMLYLNNWDFLTGGKKTDYSLYRPERYHSLPTGSGYVAPYATGPLSQEPLASQVYCNLINKAKRYVYIMTPYLIPDHDIMTALKSAAKNGVDVRILTPSHWDKYVVHALTQSHYMELLKAGVKIYEYTPGFIHAKSMVCDDELAIVGSINLDYRSLHLHFECAAWMYKMDAIWDIKKDFVDTQKISTTVTEEFCKSRPLHRRVLGWICKLFAPLM